MSVSKPESSVNSGEQADILLNVDRLISGLPKSAGVTAATREGNDVDAIVQAGTNLSNVDLFPTLEKQLGKPVIPINVATIWHALRAIGVNDKFQGRGWLFERF